MRGLFWLTAMFALAAATALGIRYSEAYVLVVLPPWRLEVSLSLLLLLLVLGFGAGYGLLRGLAATAALPARARQWRAEREQARMATQYQDALRQAGAGRDGAALQLAEIVHRSGSFAAPAAQLAAEAALRSRQRPQLAEWLQRWQEADPEAGPAILRLKIEDAVEAGDYAAALALLDTLSADQAALPSLRLLTLRTRLGLGQRQAAAELLAQLDAAAVGADTLA
ncbi:MAG: hypothetical protein RIR00_2153, partial [Pseudomonadota bacterium]